MSIGYDVVYWILAVISVLYAIAYAGGCIIIFCISNDKTESEVGMLVTWYVPVCMYLICSMLHVSDHVYLYMSLFANLKPLLPISPSLWHRKNGTYM